MKIHQCKHGSVVRRSDYWIKNYFKINIMPVSNEKRRESKMVGMIVGFSEDEDYKPLVMVQWQDSPKPKPVYPINISLLENDGH